MENYNENEYAEEVLNELTGSSNQHSVADDYSSIMDQAVMRIEEANLFKLLVNAEVFSPDSARPEILESVKRKLREFAISELNALLNMNVQKDEPKSYAPSAFDADETQALKIIAAKLLKRDISTAIVTDKTPALVPIATPRTQTQQRPQQQRVPQQKAIVPKPNPIGRTSVPDFSKVDKGFAKANPNHKKPMPTPEQMMATVGMQRPTVSVPDNASQADVQNANKMLGNILQSLTGGQSLHVDASDPADIQGVDDVNARF